MTSPRHHPPGTVGILSGDLSRWAWFHQDMLALSTLVPPGSQIVYVIGQWVAEAVNEVIRRMHPEDGWVMIHADDHRFEPDILTRLLDHQLPIVAPLVALRSPGFKPSLFHETAEGVYCGYTWQELEGQTGVVPVDTFGGPGVVIRREVIDAIGMPFFECLPGRQIAPNEDLYAFSKCRKAGFQPYVDLDIQLGHIIPSVIYPQRFADGSYGIRLWSRDTLGYLHAEPTEASVPDEPYHAYT